MASSTYSLVDINPRIAVNQTTTGSQGAPPVVTMADGSFVVAYNDGAGLIRMRQFNAAGTAMGNEVVVSGGVANDLSPKLARLSDGRLAVSWSDDVGLTDNAAVRVYSASLQPLTAQTRVNPTGTLAAGGSVAATSDGGFVVAYELQKSTTDHDIYLQRYTDTGVAVGGPIAVDGSTAYSTEARVAVLSDGGYAVAFSNRQDPASSLGSSLVRAVVNVDGSLRLAPTVTDASTSASDINATPDLLALSNGKAALTYVNGLQITTLTVNADGTLDGSVTLAGGFMGTGNPDYAVSPTGYSLTSYDVTGHATHNVGIALLEPGGTQSVATSGSVTYAAAESSVTWLDESHAVQVYSSVTYNSQTGSEITADLWQVERNTTGAATSETIWLDGLADRVTMGGGDDGVFAGDGNNTVNLGAGNDVAVGGSGPDALIGGAGVDWLYGMGGADYLYGGTETDALMGGDGNDFLFGEEGDDYAFGDAGNDAISGGAGVDRLYGGIGNDTIDGGSETDALSGEDGNDLLFGGTGDDYLFGGAGDDTLLGGTGNDLLSGDAGNDTLKGEAGNDWLIGGAGFTVFQFEGTDTGIDTIADYKPNIDSLVLIGTARTSAADVKANLVQVGANATLMTSATSGIIFLNTQVSQINERFILVA